MSRAVAVAAGAALWSTLALPACGFLGGGLGAGGAGGGGAGGGAKATGASGDGARVATKRTGTHADLLWSIGGAAVPSPVVVARLRGAPTYAMVDTGAEVHVLAEWLALRARVETRATADVLHGAAGGAAMLTVVDRPAIEISGWGLAYDRTIAMTRMPPFFETLGVGLILSPQLLATPADAVVLDFAAGRLDTGPWDDALRAISTRGESLVPLTHRVCNDPRAPVENLHYVVEGAVEGLKVSFAVDSGARVTTVYEASEAGKALAAKADAAASAAPAPPASDVAHGIGGSAPARVLKGARVRAGDVGRTLDVRVHAGPHDPSCPVDGLLGIDFLRACTLLLAPDRFYGRCPGVAPAAPPG